MPESALKLGWLPSTEAHESKHRVVKGGMLDHQKARLSNSLLLQIIKGASGPHLARRGRQLGDAWTRRLGMRRSFSGGAAGAEAPPGGRFLARVHGDETDPPTHHNC